MAFIGNLLTDGVNYVTSINTEVEREVRQETEADSNDMLRLHLNLTKSLYENKEKTYGKSSFMVVLIITLISCGTTCLFFVSHDSILTLVYSLPLVLVIWVLPMISYYYGIKTKNCCLLLPWLFVFLMHGVPMFVFLVVTTVFSVLHHTTSQPGPAPLVEVTQSGLDCFILLLTCLLCPLLAVLPVRTFIYLDNDRRIHCPCYEARSEERRLSGAEEEEEEMITVEQGTEGGGEGGGAGEARSDQPALSGLVPRLSSYIRNTLQVSTPEAATSLHPPAVTVPRVHSLFDLSSLHEDGAGEAGVEDQPPPSYSQAEGLDCPPPDYSQVEVGRVRLGRYVIVMDHNNRNIKRFKV